MDQQHIGVTHWRPGHVGRHFTQTHTLTDHQFADVDLDVLRYLGRHALNLDFAMDEVYESTLLSHPGRLAFEYHWHHDRDRLVKGELVEVDV